jgi:cytoskeletal protein RodZ
LNEIGERLKNARELAGVSLDEAGTDLNIKVAILDNLEQGNIDNFKDIFELKDYIHDYAKYLGLNPDDMIKEFNEYLFEYTSKIPVEIIEKQIAEKQKNEETQPIRIASPYTDDRGKYKNKSYMFLYVLVIILVALAIFWSVKQITVDNKVATMISWVK